MAREVSILGSLRVAGALVLDKENADFPSNPKIGTFLIKDQSLYCYIKIGNLVTWYPLFQNLSNAYIHTQALPSLQWSVSHKLNSDYYWYQIQDTEGNIIDEASRTLIDSDNFVLNFSEPVAGTCIVIGPNSVTLSNINASLLNVGAVEITTTGVTINGEKVLTAVSLNTVVNTAVASSLDQATANLQNTLQSYADTADASILQSAKDYSDYKSSQAVGNANSFADAKVTALATIVSTNNVTLNDRIDTTNSNLDSLSSELRVTINQNLNPNDVVDNLFSTASDKPLSANQGKILNDAITALGTGGGGGTTAGGETSYLAQFVGDFYPVIGDQRFYPRNTVNVKNIFAWISAIAGSNINFNIRVNDSIVETGTIIAGNLVTSVTCDFTVNSSDYITVDITSGSGKNLSIRLDF